VILENNATALKLVWRRRNRAGKKCLRTPAASPRALRYKTRKSQTDAQVVCLFSRQRGSVATRVLHMTDFSLSLAGPLLVLCEWGLI